MHLGLLGQGHAGRPVAAFAFPPFELGRRAAHTDEHDPAAGHNLQAVPQAPWLAEPVVGDDVVSGLGHARDGAVEPGPGTGQDGFQLSVVQFRVFCLARRLLMTSTDMWKWGGSSISSNCPAMLDFPELEVRSGR